MKILELFSGTGSMGRAFTNQGWKVTSQDASPKAEATEAEEPCVAACQGLQTLRPMAVPLVQPGWLRRPRKETRCLASPLGGSSFGL